MASFNELRKMNVRDLLPGNRAKRQREAEQERTKQESVNEQNRLSIIDNPYQPLLPGVNILPPEAVNRRRSRRLTRQFIAGAIAILLLSAVCYGGSVGLNYIHQQQLDAIRATNSNLNSQLTQLQPYSSYQSSLDSARKSVSGSLASDLDVGRLLKDLNSVASRYGVDYTQINVSVNGSTGAAATAGTASASTSQCLNPDPFNPPTSIGCITLSGTTSGQSAATAYFNQFNTQKGFLNGFISSLTTGSATNTNGDRSTFNGTVAFDSAFYSNKYTALATPLNSLISDASSGSTTQSSAALKTLTTEYPTVFSGISTSAVTGMVTSVCSNAAQSGASINSLTAIVNTSLNKTVASADATGIVQTVIAQACPSAQSNIAGGLTSATAGASNG